MAAAVTAAAAAGSAEAGSAEADLAEVGWEAADLVAGAQGAADSEEAKDWVEADSVDWEKAAAATAGVQGSVAVDWAAAG